MKKIVSILIVVTLIFGCLTTLPCNTYAKTKKWKTYLGLNKGWYEGAGGTIKTSKRGFTANLSKQIGWGGVWGGQAWYNYNFKKGHKYKISFKIKSGDRCVIGGNVWLTHSVEANRTVLAADAAQGNVII